MADFAESPNVLTGLASSKYVSSPKVRANIKAGRVVEVGEEGTINSEVIIATKPDLVMAMGNPTASFSKYQNLLNAGIPVVLVSEWLEHSPLGRAEWVKLMAALVNKEALVNTKFARIEKEYARLAKIGRSSLRKPSIIVGMPYKGSWFVPDGTSYMTQFFKDAGASYNWYDTKGTGSMGLNFESVAPVALKADYWINFGIANTKTDISTLDERYTYFKPFKNNTIYNFNKRVNDIGSNDYWESGVVNPHLVLSDLIKILHPEALPKHELIYYKQIL
jgi:iron complex transport system substrate-binding protein